MHLTVLDYGYVRYIDHMGDDLSVVNAAKASFEKEAAEFGDREDRLLAFLARENHSAPFRHAILCLECRAPMLVARQWWKYAVGSDHTMSGWNESSRRYVTEDPTYYLPGVGEWRSKPVSAKQGSGDPVDAETLGDALTSVLAARYEQSLRDYNIALKHGVAPEQARLFLHGYGLYVRWRWTASLNTIGHFLVERLAHDAQAEIRQYADAVRRVAHPLFPKSVEAWLA